VALSEESARNRNAWDRDADAYQRRHAGHINQPDARWGVWQIPEAELRVLGDVSGKDVLELGCGAAQWSIRLAAMGARMVGLDNSERQLHHAREAQAAADIDFPLVHASAEALPFPDASFDIVFCDHGAMSFADPHRAVPEAARVLRPGGLFTFCHLTPIDWLVYDERSDRNTTTLLHDYFELRRWAEEDGTISFQLGYGDWIRLFRANGLQVEDLIELRPAENAESTYRDADGRAWARRWPMEEIWKVRKTQAGGA
jgi:SAM-dependent methyltransferase